MNIKINPKFLFPTQYWEVELKENIKELQNESYIIKKNDQEGVIKSNTGLNGYHSKDIRNFENIPKINKLMFEIAKCVNSIHQVNRKGKLNLANFWINISGKGASNSPHVHSGNNYSGVFFIKIPKEMSGGRFLFYRNFNDAALNSMAYMGQFKDGYKMQAYDYPIITIPPKENMLLVFPSWVPHAVETNLSDEDRISLSFNFILNRSLS